ncbi:MAG: hypothetical protein NC489_31580 [Ruminococcus flavefaciens]|nr:hypothetical protein [Ruminococcus flavefaciens]
MKNNVERSIQYLNKLQEIAGEAWKQELDSYLKEEEDELSDESKGCIIDFLMTYKEEIVDNRAADLREVEKKINNDLLYKNIKDYLDDLLEPYYAFAPLRVFYVKAPNEVFGLIEELFEQTILRYNIDILQEYEQYGFENMQAFGNFLNALDGICSYVVKRNMYSRAIEDFIYNQTRLPMALCQKITELIDVNFDSMKLSYIIEKLNQMGDE